MEQIHLYLTDKVKTLNNRGQDVGDTGKPEIKPEVVDQCPPFPISHLDGKSTGK